MMAAPPPENKVLTIVTTANPNADTMTAFAKALRKTLTDTTKVKLIIVDGLHVYIAPLFQASKENIEIEWIRPPKKKSQLNAIKCGLIEAKGITLIMDPDMADNIDNINCFFEKIIEGHKIVFAWRVRRNGVSASRKILTNAFNLLARKLLSIKVHDINTPMIMFSEDALTEIKKYKKKFRSPYIIYYKYRRKMTEIKIEIKKKNNKTTYNFITLFIIGLNRLSSLILTALTKNIFQKKS